MLLLLFFYLQDFILQHRQLVGIPRYKVVENFGIFPLTVHSIIRPVGTGSTVFICWCSEWQKSMQGLSLFTRLMSLKSGVRTFERKTTDINHMMAWSCVLVAQSVCTSSDAGFLYVGLLGDPSGPVGDLSGRSLGPSVSHGAVLKSSAGGSQPLRNFG